MLRGFLRRIGFAWRKFPQHLVLRCERLPGERSPMTVITAGLSVVVGAVGIHTAVWIRGQNCAKKQANAERELYDCQIVFHGADTELGSAPITLVVAGSQA